MLTLFNCVCIIFHLIISYLLIIMETLVKVELQADVYMVCLQHALSTENFEVMGLLIGNLTNGIAKVSAGLILQRLDKKKDRVEISAEQLSSAAEKAENLESDLKQPMKIVGWYHSHPHITVAPSHVDVRTQANYQLLESRFVGLIFSVFSESKEKKEQEVVLTCFQSHNDKAKEIPLEIIQMGGFTSTCLNTMKELPEILIQEEEVAEPDQKNSDILADIHNDAVKIRTHTHITDIITKPLIEIFEQRLEINKLRQNYFQRKLLELTNKLEEN